MVSAEIPDIAAAFPIAFREDDCGVKPVAILSMNDHGKNLFVSEEGHWRANYIPSILRCHPFLAEPADTTGNLLCSEFTLLVNESTGLVSMNGSGTPFFTCDGLLSPELQEVQRFFQRFHAQRLAALHACKLMAELGVFTRLSENEAVSLPDGLLGVNFHHVDQLPPAHVALLLSCGAMQLIFAHKISLSHIGWLIKVQDLISTRTLERQHSPDSELDCFLDAVVTAQDFAAQEAAHAYY